MTSALKKLPQPVESHPSPLEIIEFISEANLREVSWNQKFLEKIKVTHNLQHRQAVVFCNLAQDRFRLVANFFGMAVLVLPPIDPQDRISLYLKISQFLHRMAATSVRACAHLDDEINGAQQRLDRRQALAQAAVTARKERQP
jgi:hypothetical protein